MWVLGGERRDGGGFARERRQKRKGKVEEENCGEEGRRAGKE